MNFPAFDHTHKARSITGTKGCAGRLGERLSSEPADLRFKAALSGGAATPAGFIPKLYSCAGGYFAPRIDRKATLSVERGVRYFGERARFNPASLEEGRAHLSTAGCGSPGPQGRTSDSPRTIASTLRCLFSPHTVCYKTTYNPSTEDTYAPRAGVVLVGTSGAATATRIGGGDRRRGYRNADTQLAVTTLPTSAADHFCG